MEAEPAARNVNAVHYAGANQAALPLINAKIRQNPSIYPPRRSSTAAS
jgi:spermidine/putrescine-binding protein